MQQATRRCAMRQSRWHIPPIDLDCVYSTLFLVYKFHGLESSAAFGAALQLWLSFWESFSRPTSTAAGRKFIHSPKVQKYLFPPSVAVSVRNVESIIGVVLAVWVADADNEHEKRIHFLYTDIFKKVE
jgi:hypothetical protein